MGYPRDWLLLCTLLNLLGTSTLQEVGRYGMRIRPLNNSYTTRIQKDNAKNAINKPNSFLGYPNATSTNQQSKNILTSPAITLEQSHFQKWPKENQQSPQGLSLAERYKKDATFFFTHVEPHRFEYRAMFQHPSPKFEPFVHHFEPFGGEFPPLPKFPKIFADDPFPKLPDFADFPFPTIRPAIRRAWAPAAETQTARPILNENLDGPLKNYDIVLGHAQYPKIFRFNEERINIEEFDRQKKLKFKNAEFNHNHISDTENVKRNQLLILHGGIFTVKEPPLYNRKRKTRKHSYGYKIPFNL